MDFLGNSHSQSNQEAAHALAEAYKKYFDPKLKRFGEPKFKKKKNGGKFYLPCQSKNISFCETTRKIRIKPLDTFIKKNYRGEYHENDYSVFEIDYKPNGLRLPNEYDIKGITIEKDYLGYYHASFTIKHRNPIAEVDHHIDSVQASGFDLGISKQIIMSNGTTKDLNDKHKKLEEQRAELQRALSKKIEARKLDILKKRKSPSIPSKQLKKIKRKRDNDKFQAVRKKHDRTEWKEIKRDNSFSKDEWKEIYDSNNIQRLQRKSNLLSKKIANIRKDHNHKLSKMIIDNNTIVIFEDLNIQGMTQNKRLSKSILDKGWGQLKSFVKYKAENQGKIYHEIDRFFPSSKTCHECGHKLDELPLKIREWVCPECLAHHCRDRNAAINILRQGLLELGYLQKEVDNYIQKVKFHTTLAEEDNSCSVDAERHSA
jgi:IS605 OrfB family transposase